MNQISKQFQSLEINTLNQKVDQSIFLSMRSGTYQKKLSIQRAAKDSEMRIRNRRLAEHLITLLVIGKGRDIVPLIGGGVEKSNLDAVIGWVAINVEDLMGLSYQEQLDVLLKKLRKDLNAAVDQIMSS